MMKLATQMLVLGALVMWLGCSEDGSPSSDASLPDGTQPDTTLPDVPDTTTPDTNLDVETDTPAVPDVDPGDGADVPPLDTGSMDVPKPPDGQTPDVGPPTPQPEEAQLLLFINHATTTKSILVGEVGLGGQTPGAIITYRAGADGILNSADDVSIQSSQELDELPYVGAKSLEKLWAFSRNWSESNSDPVLALLNAPTLTLSQLDATIGLDADEANALIAYRAGTDGVQGTDDDQFFMGRTDVLDVTFVGKSAVVILEQAVGLGALELLDSGTAAGLVDITMNALGEALIVGTPLGLSGHAFWFTPFSEEAFTSEDEPYEFIDISEVMPEALTGVAFDEQAGVGYAVGEVAGLYVFDPFIHEASFVPKADVPVFSDVAVDAVSGDVYAASADSEVIVRFHSIGLMPELVASVSVNALAYTGSNPAVLTGVADAGSVIVFDGGGLTSETVGAGEVLYSVASLSTLGQRLVTGGQGLSTAQNVNWDRWPTRSLRTIRGSSMSPDGDTVLLVGEGGTVLVYFHSTGVLAPITSPVGVDFSAVAFATDGTALIVGDAGVVLQYTPSTN